MLAPREMIYVIKMKMKYATDHKAQLNYEREGIYKV
jgi:hypothetical protein